MEDDDFEVGGRSQGMEDDDFEVGGRGEVQEEVEDFEIGERGEELEEVEDFEDLEDFEVSEEVKDQGEDEKPGKSIQGTYPNVLVFVTDGASYMKRAGRLMQASLTPNLKHITCTTHGLHLVADNIRQHYEKNGHLSEFMVCMNQILAHSSVRKELFRKSESLDVNRIRNFPIDDETDFVTLLNQPFNPKWCELFQGESEDLWARVRREMATSQGEYRDENGQTKTVPLPPQPVITRFGTWVVAVNYYRHYFHAACNFALSLGQNSNKDLSAVVKKLQDLVREKSGSIFRDIREIYDNFRDIPIFIARTERANMELAEANEILDEFKKYLETAAKKDVKAAAKAIVKFDEVKKKNQGLKQLVELARKNKVLAGAPATTAEIEQLFSFVANRLGKRRHFADENFIKYFESILNTRLPIKVHILKQCLRTLLALQFYLF